VRPHSPSPTWTVIRSPSSRARLKSSTVTGLVVNCGPRSAMAIVTRPSSLAKCWSRTRRASAGWGTALGGSRHWGAPPPWANTTRPPESRNACTAASAWSGVARLWDQSTSVVMPESSASSVPSRLPA
jgi:hypothetical protein